MSAYISNDLNMVKELDPQRHELALLQEAYLGKGGTIEVLEGPSFKPPPERHEPPRKKAQAKPAPKPATTPYIDKITQRDIDREERVAQRAKDKAERVEYICKLAETMTYAQATLHTGLPLRSLQRIAVEGGFKFQPAINNGYNNLKPKRMTEEEDAKYAERIKACKESGISRNQAIQQVRIGFKTFARILEKFEIDYPKHRAGPHPAFFPKNKEASQ